jgi:hypothetical protein
LNSQEIKTKYIVKLMFQLNIYEYAFSFKVIFNKLIDMSSRGTNSLINLMNRFLLSDKIQGKNMQLYINYAVVKLFLIYEN